MKKRIIFICLLSIVGCGEPNSLKVKEKAKETTELEVKEKPKETIEELKEITRNNIISLFKEGQVNGYFGTEFRFVAGGSKILQIDMSNSNDVKNDSCASSIPNYSRDFGMHTDQVSVSLMNIQDGRAAIVFTCNDKDECIDKGETMYSNCKSIGRDNRFISDFQFYFVSNSAARNVVREFNKLKSL